MSDYPEPMDQPLWGPAPTLPSDPVYDAIPRAPIVEQPQPLRPPPPPVPVPPVQLPPRLPVRQRRPGQNTWLLVSAAVVVIVLTLVLVGVVVTRHPNTTSTAPDPAGVQYSQDSQDAQATTDATTTDPATITDVPTTDPPTTPPNTDTLTQAETGPDGMRLQVPAGWTTRSGTSPSVTELDNPTVPGQYLRFGAAPPVVAGTLLDAVESYEQTTPTIQTDYQRVQLTSVSFGDAPEAVEWEFTFTGNGGTRHAAGLYWRIDGIEYVLYVSSYDTDWDTTDQVFQAVQATVTPS